MIEDGASLFAHHVSSLTWLSQLPLMGRRAAALPLAIDGHQAVDVALRSRQRVALPRRAGALCAHARLDQIKAPILTEIKAKGREAAPCGRRQDIEEQPVGLDPPAARPDEFGVETMARGGVECRPRP